MLDLLGGRAVTLTDTPPNDDDWYVNLDVSISSISSPRAKGSTDVSWDACRARAEKLRRA